MLLSSKPLDKPPLHYPRRVGTQHAAKECATWCLLSLRLHDAVALEGAIKPFGKVAPPPCPFYLSEMASSSLEVMNVASPEYVEWRAVRVGTFEVGLCRQHI